MDLASLEDIAGRLAARGKGILASDESTGTIGKRLEKAGLENTEDIRRAYREIFYTAPIGQYISGAIMFKETLYQSTAAGVPFVKCLCDQDVLPGIKVDEGLTALVGNSDGETSTRGLDALEPNCREYRRQGARFAKWRAVLKINDRCPSHHAVEYNAMQLAEYAAICQACDLVPIVEPEILMDGTHSIQTFAEVSERVISTCVTALWRRNVHLEATLLKPQMIVPGTQFAGSKPSYDDIAQHTVRTMRRVVPAAMPGIMFLSGGLGEEEATLCLNAINQHAGNKAPWSLSFSFGRGLQASVLHTWAGQPLNAAAAANTAVALAAANAAASTGSWSGKHPSVLGGSSSSSSLHETFRGWHGNAPNSK